MYALIPHTKLQCLHASGESGGWGGVTEEVIYTKTTPDFTKLVADSHLTQEEARIMRKLYESKKANITLAIKWQLKDFIIKDYGEANKQYLGGSEWVMALQKILWVQPDGSFWPDTFKALIEYQGNNWLEKDGIAWPETMKKMGIANNVHSAMPVAQNKSTTATLINKNTEKWWIKNKTSAPLPTASVEIPRKDVWKILSSFEFKLTGIQNSFSDLKKHRDENTGFFNALADDLVNLAGWESGKKIYERSNQNIKNQASEMIKNLDTSLNWVPLSDTERSQYLKIRSGLEKTLGHTLGEPNPFVAMKNSIMDVPTTVVNTVKWTAWVLVWAAEGVYWAIKWALDLTIFITRYAGSSIGEYMWVNPDYKNKMDAEIKKIWNMVSGMDFTKDQVLGALSQGFDQIKGDPYAIGKLAGIVIGILLPIRWAGVLNNTVRGRKAVAQTAESAAEAAVKLGKPAEKIAAAKYASKLAKVDAFIWKVGEFVLNGPAESAIGAALAKSFRLASGAIRWGVSAKNLKTVEKSIEDFGDAMKNETNPEKLKYIQEAKEALEYERDKLAKNIAAKKTTKETTEWKKPLSELETELAKKKAELAKSEDMARTPHGWASDGLLANEARLKKEIESLEQRIKEQVSGSSAKSQSPWEKSNNPEPEAKAKESGIPSNAPKNFDVSWIDTPERFKKVYRKVAMYYHSDRNSHPDSDTLFRELKDAFEKKDADRFARVAKNPNEYLKNKDRIAGWVEKSMKHPTEVLLDRLSDYEKVFSESYLRQLATSDAREFWEALLNQFHIRQIKELAKTDPVLALTKWEAYLKSPQKYLESVYAPPYHSIDNDIRQFANQAYARWYQTEWDALKKSYKDAYENWLKNNPDVPKWSFEQVQRIIGDFDEVVRLLWNKASEITKNIEEIIKLLKWNIKNNISEIRTNIDALIESVRLNKDLGLDIKARVSKKFKEIKDALWLKEKGGSHVEPSQKAPEVKTPKQEKWLRAFDYNEIKFNDLSGDANKFFYDPEIPKPIHKVTVNWKEFYLTDAFWNKKTILWYVSVNGKLEPRYFYFSDSGANWHCAPGVDNVTQDWARLSKWEQWNDAGYAKWTVVSNELQEAFNSVWINPMGPKSFSGIWGKKLWALDENGLKDHSKFNEFHERYTYDISDPQWMSNHLRLDDLKHMQIDPKMNISFHLWFKEGPKLSPHKYLWPLESKIWMTTYNGQPIDVIFAWTKDRPDLIWIENILIKDCPVDSFGIPQVVFNGWLLTAKPAEYLSQVPEYIAKNWRKLTEGKDPYIDIRTFLQENPLIVQFKKLTGMKEAA